MSVKYINCYGTSFTQGGGFEYWRFNGIKIAYQGLSPMIANTHWEFSWPCQLQKFVGNNMTVRNYGKCGFGNERIYRKTHEIINKPDFKSEEHIFLFEFSDVGRKEFYHAYLDDYVICNYYFNSEDGETILEEEVDRPRKFNQLSLALDYWFETQDQEKILDYDLGNFREHMKKTTTLRNTISTMSKNIEMFLSYLEFNKIQYVIVQKPFTFELFNWDKLFKHRCLKQDIGVDMKDAHMTIWDETNPHTVDDGEENEFEGIDDRHGGYSWAIKSAKSIFDDINSKFFKNKLNPNWEGLTYDEVKKTISDNFTNYKKGKLDNEEFEQEFLKRSDKQTLI